jgi:plasmid stabilization system protein ParE
MLACSHGIVRTANSSVVSWCQNAGLSLQTSDGLSHGKWLNCTCDAFLNLPSALTLAAPHARDGPINGAIQALRDGLEILGSTLRDDIAPGIRTLHVARSGRKGRHLVVFRVGGDRTIDVLRLLHDSMDLPRHLSTANDL